MSSVFLLAVCAMQPTSARTVPQLLSGHPGNVFVKGEIVQVPLPDGAAWGMNRYHMPDDGWLMFRGAFGCPAEPVIAVQGFNP